MTQVSALTFALSEEYRRNFAAPPASCFHTLNYLVDNYTLALILNHMVQHSARQMDRVMTAISDPTRRAILERLSRGPARISDLAQPFPMSLSGFSKHIRVLERARLIRRTRRGRDNTLHISPEPLRAIAHWVLKYGHFWNERLDRLESFIAKEKE